MTISKSILSKSIIFLIVMIALMAINLRTVFAAPAGVPSYGTTSEFDVFEPFGPWQSGWQQCGNAYRYSGWDSDTEFFYNAVPASYSLSTNSQSKVTLTGSGEYNFAAIAKASLSLSVGETWGKSYTMSVTPAKYTKYVLWSANTDYIRNYTYNNGDLSAKSYDKYGSTKWFWSEAIAH